MSIIQKSIPSGFVVQNINEMRISNKSKRLLKDLFLGDKKDAANILKSFSFSATSDVTMVLLVAAILACTKNIQTTKHGRYRPDNYQEVFKFMGAGDGVSAATQIPEDDFEELIYSLLKDYTSLSSYQVTTKIKNRIRKISKWKHSAKTVKNYILPILEQVLSGTTYTKFYAAFKNAMNDQKKRFTPKLECDEEDVKSIMKNLKDPFATKLGVSSDKIDNIWIARPLYRTVNATPDNYDKSNITLKYIYFSRIDKYGIFLSKGDILRAFVDAEGNQKQCVDLLVKRATPSLLKLEEKIKDNNITEV